MLPNPDGKFGRFYDRFLGNRVILFFYPSSTEPHALDELLAFNAQREALAAAGARVVAVSRDSAVENARVAAAHGLKLTLFSDPAGAITGGYGAARDGACTCYVLDRNQRVLDVIAGGGDHANRALARLIAHAPPATPARTIGAQAPVLVLPNVVDPALCSWSIAAWQADHEEGAVRQRAGNLATDEARTRVIDHSMKKRLDHRPDDALDAALRDTVMSRIGPEIYKAFQFRVVAAERFCIGAYEAGRGDYFQPHRDNTTERTANRRFTVTLNLNDAYSGGGVRFTEFSDDVYRPPAGGALIFSCSLLHEALPVIEGTRFAALTFMFGAGDVPPPPA